MGCAGTGTMLIILLVSLLSIPVLGQSQGPFGPVPSADIAAGNVQPVPAPVRGLTFIVIPLYHASAELIAYAVRADDVIWDVPQGGSSGGGGSGGRGSTGRSGSGYGSSGSSRGRSGSNGY